MLEGLLNFCSALLISERWKKLLTATDFKSIKFIFTGCKVRTNIVGIIYIRVLKNKNKINKIFID